MQRKNYLLANSSKKSHRNGIAMIMAIAVIVTIATILALSLSMTNTTTKKTSGLYLYEQSEILSHSAAEYAMLKIAQAALCSVKNLNFTYNTIYNISVGMKYISTTGSTCTTNAGTSNLAIVTHEPTNGTVILDITVDVNDTSVTTEPIRYFRRTIQKL